MVQDRFQFYHISNPELIYSARRVGKEYIIEWREENDSIESQYWSVEDVQKSIEEEVWVTTPPDKSVFLYVKGGDYSALKIEQNFNIEEVYKQMNEEGKTSIVLEDKDHYIEVEIKEFEKVNDDFLDFVINKFCDYDDLKHSNIYQVK